MQIKPLSLNFLNNKLSINASPSHRQPPTSSCFALQFSYEVNVKWVRSELDVILLLIYATVSNRLKIASIILIILLMEFSCNLTRSWSIKKKFNEIKETRAKNFLIMSDVYACMSVQNFFLEVERIYSRNGKETVYKWKRAMRNWHLWFCSFHASYFNIRFKAFLSLSPSAYPLISFSLWLTQSITSLLILLTLLTALRSPKPNNFFSAIPQELLFFSCAILIFFC